MKENIILKLESIKKEYEDIALQLNDSEIYTKNIELSKELNKKQKSLENTYKLFIEWKNLNKDIYEAEELIPLEKDKELLNEFKNLVSENKKKIIDLEEEIYKSISPQNKIDEKNCTFEIQSGAGGDESSIFVSDLFDMYTKYFAKHDYSFEIIEINKKEVGISNIFFKVKGEKAYGKFKYESGVHRVQRVPSTESLGRVHTSTIKVIVMPELEIKNIEILSSDLRIDTYRASGAGGQHINKTDSAVRITHIPTGIVTTSQSGRSQHDNKDKALKSLKEKISQQLFEKENEESNKKKKNIVGTGDRSEKIRTYNYPQNRITDHRIGLTLKKLDRVMEGNLDEIINSLISLDE